MPSGRHLRTKVRWLLPFGRNPVHTTTSIPSWASSHDCHAALDCLGNPAVYFAITREDLNGRNTGTPLALCVRYSGLAHFDMLIWPT
jgi:hypothetical protein